MSEKQIIERIKRNLIDVGIVTTSYALRGIAEMPLFDEPLLCYVSKGHRLFSRKKIHPGDLSIEELWLLKEGNALRDQVIALCPLEKSSTVKKNGITFESDSLESLKRLVENGHGMTVVPRLAVVDPAPFKTELLREFEQPVPHRIVRMVYATTLLQEQLARALADEIKEAATLTLKVADYERAA